MVVIQFILALVIGAVILAVGVTIIGGVIAGVAGLILVGLCIALMVYLVKTHWKPTATGYYAFTRQDGAFVGKPGIAMSVWRLQQGNTCAINAQRMVLAICGIHKSESELAKRNQAYGLHSERGSSDIANLMLGYGLAVRGSRVATKDAFVEQLFYALREGRLAVATVNADLLNTPDPLFRTQSRVIPNHAILLTGLRNIGGGHYLVYYTDSGVSDGALKSVDARVMQEAAGPQLVNTPVLFDGGKRLWPYSPTGLDAVHVGESSDDLIIAPCPQCEKRLRFRLSRESRVACPRCKYCFKAIKGEPDRRSASWHASDWDQAGRERPSPKKRKDSAGARRTAHQGSAKTTRCSKQGATFVEVKATCNGCQNAFSESVVKGPETVPLQCPGCGDWGEYPTR